MNTISFRSLAAIALLSLTPACDGVSPVEPASDPTPASPSPNAEDGTPTPVASLALASGQSVEFYDLGGTGLVVESGEAGQTPVLNDGGEIRADQLVDVWRRLAPDRAVPTTLVNLQQRMMRAEGPDPTAPPRARAVVEPGFGGEPISLQPPAGIPEGTLAAPDGCNNGCCDYEWLRTFGQCSTRGDYQWFLYNYGYSWAKSSDIVLFNGVVCAAVGTSTYRLTVEGGGGGVWSIKERYYKTFRVVAPVCCNDPNIEAKVNTSTTQALHTQCGLVYK